MTDTFMRPRRRLSVHLMCLTACAALLSACGSSTAPGSQDDQAAQEQGVGSADGGDETVGAAQLTLPMYGVIQSRVQRLKSDYAAGLRTRTLELAWDRYEPASGQWNQSYINSVRGEYQADVQAGFKVVLDLGVQYPPAWVKSMPEARFVDQDGRVYASPDPGANPVNAVFSKTVREVQARYVTRVFEQLGSGFMAVRLGWGRYGELGYPPLEAANNSYWAYDDFAQGRRVGLPDGVRVSPLPGWSPSSGVSAAGSEVSAQERQNARAFSEWYLNSLQNYHDWQIDLVRRSYRGRIFMLYPSFGLRPGQLDRAVAGGLRGQTSPEINTEVQRGFDFARYIGHVRDPLVSPYTTWLDMNGFFVDDASSDSGAWSTAHYFSLLARENPLHLQVWGENTGNNSLVDMRLCARRIRDYNLGGMYWAFNEDLYSGEHASIRDYTGVIKQ